MAVLASANFGISLGGSSGGMLREESKTAVRVPTIMAGVMNNDGRKKTGQCCTLYTLSLAPYTGTAARTLHPQHSRARARNSEETKRWGPGGHRDTRAVAHNPFWGGQFAVLISLTASTSLSQLCIAYLSSEGIGMVQWRQPQHVCHTMPTCGMSDPQTARRETGS